MDSKREALELSRESIELILKCGTQVDDIYRRFRELRLRTEELSFQGALLNVEHSFFMLVQAMNILRENLKLIEVATKKEEPG
jgi:hypothetical protein